jgi:hypothetical protein
VVDVERDLKLTASVIRFMVTQQVAAPMTPPEPEPEVEDAETSQEPSPESAESGVAPEPETEPAPVADAETPAENGAGEAGDAGNSTDAEG